MITVRILVNEVVMYESNATCVQDNGSKDFSEYLTDNDVYIKHKKKDGVLPLAVAMIKTLRDKR